MGQWRWEGLASLSERKAANRPGQRRLIRCDADPVSQDQTMTVLFFRHHCVVLKFLDHTMTGRCPVLGGHCLVLLHRAYEYQHNTSEEPARMTFARHDVGLWSRGV